MVGKKPQRTTPRDMRLRRNKSAAAKGTGPKPAFPGAAPPFKSKGK